MAPAVDLRCRDMRASSVRSAKRVGAVYGQIRGLNGPTPAGLLGDSNRDWCFFLSRAIGAGGLYVSGLYFCAYSAYCLANFAQCREAHCIITGLGWGALGIVALVAAVMRLDLLGPVWNAFLIVAILGHGFELIWAATRHTHALRM